MAIDININDRFQEPTLVLITRSGKKLGVISPEGLTSKFPLNAAKEISFTVQKNISEPDVNTNIWDELTDLKLVWVKEWNKIFQIAVEIDEGEGLSKFVSGVGLGEAELSQVGLYEIEINTEADISRDDYVVTVLYDETNPQGSLLNRITEKVPHYIIKHVDASIANIQRTYTFDGTTIYDAFQEIAQEVNGIFIIDCSINDNGDIVREISVYDLETYGNNTNIFISTDNLTDDIRYSTDVDSVKNCFRLQAGDDLMTASVRNCNPNGSSYIWYLSDEMKADMTSSLRDKINDYDDLYNYYQREYSLDVTAQATTYNQLIDKYSVYTADYEKINSPIVGYPALMRTYYDAIDFYYYLHDALMPTAKSSDTSAQEQLDNLTSEVTASGFFVGVPDDSSISSSTAESAIEGMARVIVDYRYQIKLETTTFTNNVWRGKFTITNYSDEEDTATSSSYVNITINDDYETYVYQKMCKVLQKKDQYTVTDIISLFGLPLDRFKLELKKYSYTNLLSLRDSCQACVDVLVEQGIANKVTWAGEEQDLYTNMYLKYYNELGAIDDEVVIRESECETIMGAYRDDGTLETHGMISKIIEARDDIQEALNFENYLGTDLWHEFSSYRREDTYQNSNYISDGLNNMELFEKSLEFLEVANKEIYKSATLQHSISSTLANLLVIPEFEPIIDSFELGNWLTIRVNDKLYRLRLIEYEVDFDNLENITVVFSDVINTTDGANDINSILNQAASMATSYDAVVKQAKQGVKTANKVNDWIGKGMSLTTMKIVNDADNQNVSWDNNGFLAREYLPITNTYDDRQLKIINRGLYVTDDNWLTSKAGIGNFTFWNPKTKQTEEAYGVIADTLVGNMILSSEVGVYNTTGSVNIDENGVSVTADATSGDNKQSITINRKTSSGTEPVFYVDSNGVLQVKGAITATSLTLGDGASIDAGDVSGLASVATSGKYSDLSGTPNLNIYIAKDGTVGNTPAAGSTGFLVSSAGLLQASNAVIYGTTYSTAGEIGGLAIDNNSIHTSGMAVTSNADNSVALSSSTFTRTINGVARNNLKLAIGSRFGVSNNGTLYASNAVIKGAITATSLTLDGASIDADDVDGLATVATSGKYSDLTGTPTIPDVSIYIAKDGTIGNTPAEGTTGFVVTSEGLLKASNAVIYGTTYSTAGEIGGFEIKNNAIRTGLTSFSDTSHEGVYIGPDGIALGSGRPTGEQAVAGVAIAGTSKVGTTKGKFRVTNEGEVTASNLEITGGSINLNNGVFKVNRQGELTATSATIRGAITATSLTLASGVTVGANKVSGLASVATSGKYSDLSGTPDVTVFIKKDGTLGTVGDGTTGFNVSSAGLLQASNAIIWGKLYSSEGSIGGLTLSGNSMYSGKTSISDANNGVYIGTDGISLGKSDAFKVTNTGAVTASNLIINGGQINLGTNDAFKVTNDGAVTAKSLTLTGSSSITLGSTPSETTTGFKVTLTGGLSASDVTIWGDIHARSLYLDDGVEISKDNITGLDVYISKDGKVGTGTLPADLISSGGKTFRVSSEGLLQAQNAVISGTVYASAGEIGGWTIDSTKLSYGTWHSSGGILLKPSGTTTTDGAQSFGGSDSITGWVFTAGTTFGLTKAGVLYATGAHISGDITASSLTLTGSAKVPANKVSDLATVATSGDYSDLDNKPVLPSDFSIYIYKDGTVGNTPAEGSRGFVVQNDGRLIASDVIVYGTTYSSAGEIGGFTIANNAIKTGLTSFTDTSHNGVYIGPEGIALGSGVATTAHAIAGKAVAGTAVVGTSPGRFKVTNTGEITATNLVVTGGSINLNNGIFKVTRQGELTATSATIRGAITATSLTLGSDVTIPKSKITGMDVYIYKDGTVGSTPAEGATGFKVSSAGLLTASNAVIYGTTYSTAGQIGGFTIANSALYAGKSSLTDANEGVYIHPDGIALGANSAFKVTSSGELTATSVDITGVIKASSGTIGSASSKITISDSTSYASLYSGSHSSFGSTVTGFYLGTNGLSIGSKFSVTSAGAVTCSDLTISGGSIDLNSSAFKVTTTGVLTATAGTIAGWTITNTPRYLIGKQTSETATTRHGVYLDAGTTAAGVFASDFAIYTRSTTDGGSTYTYPFYIRYDGRLHAGDADITGTVYMNTGYIGGANGFTVTTNYFSSNGRTSITDGKEGVFIGTTGIALGSTFKVTSAGAVTATNLSLTGGNITLGSNFSVSSTGSLMAQDGTIGGWTISGNSIYCQSSAYGAYLFAYNNDPSNVAFCVDNRSTGNHLFCVRYSGAVTASNLEITGGSVALTGDTQSTNKVSVTYGSGSAKRTCNVSPYQFQSLSYNDKIEVRIGNGRVDFVDTTISSLAPKAMIGLTGANATGSSYGSFGLCGTSNTTVTISGRGDTGVLTCVSLTQTSDRNQKKDIEYLDSSKSADLIYSLKPAQFRFIDTNEDLHHGFIAQDVEEVADWDVVNDTESGKTLNYVELIADLVATVQSLNERIKVLENK